ncbi:MAG: UDP-N-acetylmuramate--L-alanine ligase [Deltaproteobacteria bacterium]|jgi:UDP-N-acetylmuramate--alanine ligase|nr:UDP-N-acetylmuramate--L-alanine ligase [Deltaproteobacteria bacterium]
MVGIGGAGMSGIAEVLHNLGYTVAGSDAAENAAVRRLRGLGVNVHVGHDAANLDDDVNVVVRSTAIADDNDELAAARERGISIIPRAEMLAELMRLRKSIAIAGTHGKTTTTSLTATIFEEAGFDPTVIIGGKLNAYGTNARLGTGDYLIAEADESDGSFLCLLPIMNVVTNIDLDHADHYPSLASIDEAFLAFMNNVPFYGVNVVCGDDPGVRRVIHRVKRPLLTYGFGAGNDLTAEILSLGESSVFNVRLKGCRLGQVELNQPGKHNVLNALAAIGVAMQAQIPAPVCMAGLRKFNGVGRRFERKGLKNDVLVVDDYAHHPAEIKATLATARQCFPLRRLVVAFQPHRFSRTQALFGDFCKAFGDADELLLTEIYPASEAPIPGVSGQSLAQGIKQVSKTSVTYFEGFGDMLAALPDILKPGDLFITMGAGSIWSVGQNWLDQTN